MGPETPLPLPPFACRKVAGGSHGRPRTGTRPRGKGTAPPTGAAAPVSGRPPPGRHRVKELGPSGPSLSCLTYFYRESSHSCSKTGQKYFSQKVGFEKTSIWSSYRSKCSISGFPGRGKMARRIDTDLPGKRFNKNEKSGFRAEARTLSFSEGKVQSGHLGGAPEMALLASRPRIVTFGVISRAREKVAPSRFTVALH